MGGFVQDYWKISNKPKQFYIAHYLPGHRFDRSRQPDNNLQISNQLINSQLMPITHEWMTLISAKYVLFLNYILNMIISQTCQNRLLFQNQSMQPI